MDQVIEQTTSQSLADVLSREVARYEARSDRDQLMFVSDVPRGIYAVLIVPGNEDERPAWAFVLARVAGDFVIIDEEGPPDKPLHKALIHNGGIPRDRIILAYKGETLPEQTHS